jgi:chromosome segregation ATPase
MSDDLEKRQFRLEDAVSKLTTVTTSINGFIAVHDSRMTDTNRRIVDLEDDIKNIEKLVRENCSKMDSRLDKLERYLWMVVGGGIVVSWILSNMDKVNKIIN